jgi:hypothetical protein
MANIISDPIDWTDNVFKVLWGDGYPAHPPVMVSLNDLKRDDWFGEDVFVDQAEALEEGEVIEHIDPSGATIIITREQS